MCDCMVITMYAWLICQAFPEVKINNDHAQQVACYVYSQSLHLWTAVCVGLRHSDLLTPYIPLQRLHMSTVE